MNLNKIKKYIEEEGIEFEVELEEDDFTKTQIELNPILFSKYFVLFYKEIYNKLKGSNCLSELEQIKEEYNNLRDLIIEYNEYPINQGKNLIKNKIMNYYKKVQLELSDFFDMAWEVFGL